VKFKETCRERSENVKTNKIKFFQQNENLLHTNEIENKEDWEDAYEGDDSHVEVQERKKLETRSQERRNQQ